MKIKMIRITIVLLLLLSSIVSFSQIDDRVKILSKNVNERLEPLPQSLTKKEIKVSFSGHYMFTNNSPSKLSKQKILGEERKFVPITNGYKVNVLGMENDSVVYEFLPFKDTSVANVLNNKIFIASPSDFDELTIPLYHRFKGTRIGSYSIPFRLRGSGKDFDFENSLSLQANLVGGFGRRVVPTSELDFSIGIGLSSANLSNINSNAEDERTAATFTISSGAIYKPSQYVNIGVFVGWDFLGKKDSPIDWIHNKKPWLGLGINISFNEIQTIKSSNEAGNIK